MINYQNGYAPYQINPLANQQGNGFNKSPPLPQADHLKNQ
jgi:hypothetical protein